MSVASIVNGSLALSNLAIVNTTTEGACGICLDTNNNLIVSENTTMNQNLTVGSVVQVGTGDNTLFLNPNYNSGTSQISYSSNNLSNFQIIYSITKFHHKLLLLFSLLHFPSNHRLLFVNGLILLLSLLLAFQCYFNK